MDERETPLQLPQEESLAGPPTEVTARAFAEFQGSYGDRGPASLQSWLHELGVDPDSRTAASIIGGAANFERKQQYLLGPTAGLHEADEIASHRIAADFLEGYKMALLGGDTSRYSYDGRTRNPDNLQITGADGYGYQEAQLSDPAAKRVGDSYVYYLFRPGEPDKAVFFGNRGSDGRLEVLSPEQVAKLKEPEPDSRTPGMQVLVDITSVGSH